MAAVSSPDSPTPHLPNATIVAANPGVLNHATGSSGVCFRYGKFFEKHEELITIALLALAILAVVGLILANAPELIEGSPLDAKLLLLANIGGGIIAGLSLTALAVSRAYLHQIRKLTDQVQPLLPLRPAKPEDFADWTAANNMNLELLQANGLTLPKLIEQFQEYGGTIFRTPLVLEAPDNILMGGKKVEEGAPLAELAGAIPLRGGATNLAVVCNAGANRSQAFLEIMKRKAENNPRLDPSRFLLAHGAEGGCDPFVGVERVVESGTKIGQFTPLMGEEAEITLAMTYVGPPGAPRPKRTGEVDPFNVKFGHERTPRFGQDDKNMEEWMPGAKYKGEVSPSMLAARKKMRDWFDEHYYGKLIREGADMVAFARATTIQLFRLNEVAAKMLKENPRLDKAKILSGIRIIAVNVYDYTAYCTPAQQGADGTFPAFEKWINLLENAISVGTEGEHKIAAYEPAL